MKEAPKDDEELERQEEGDIDKGFTESSSSSEDELTEEGERTNSRREFSITPSPAKKSYEPLLKDTPEVRTPLY